MTLLAIINSYKPPLLPTITTHQLSTSQATIARDDLSLGGRLWPYVGDAQGEWVDVAFFFANQDEHAGNSHGGTY